ncbi:MAG: hypothetical protein HKN92_12620 [Chitinophagales bacterium]|nr:hypothetical protein [Chitinophagales bacterium]
MSAIIRMFLLFVVIYIGVKFIRGIIESIISSDKKNKFREGKATIDDLGEQPKPFEDGEYIEFEEVKEIKE